MTWTSVAPHGLAAVGLRSPDRGDYLARVHGVARGDEGDVRASPVASW